MIVGSTSDCILGPAQLISEVSCLLQMLPAQPSLGDVCLKVTLPGVVWPPPCPEDFQTVCYNDVNSAGDWMRLSALEIGRNYSEWRVYEVNLAVEEV